MSKELAEQSTFTVKRSDTVKRAIGAIGTDNLSLIFAIVVLILLITIVSGWFGYSGGDKFFSWQNLMNSLAQAIVIVRTSCDW